MEINRLKKKEIDSVFREGKEAREKYLLLKVKRNKLNTFRLAFIISRKISKKAVVRNKIRRRLKEIVRKKDNKAEGWDIIFIPLQKLTGNESFQEMKEIVNTLFTKLEINV